MRSGSEVFHAGDAGYDEVVDAVPVLDARAHSAAPLVQGPARTPATARAAASSAAVQAAAAAAGGFVAGAALLGLVARRQRRRALPASAGRRRTRLTGRRSAQAAGGARELVQILGTRSLLVDVHLLAGPSAPGQS